MSNTITVITTYTCDSCGFVHSTTKSDMNYTYATGLPMNWVSFTLEDSCETKSKKSLFHYCPECKMGKESAKSPDFITSFLKRFFELAKK